MKSSRKLIALLFFIALATGAIYLRTLGFEFVSYDDGVYVEQNEHVRPGLTWDGIVYAFTTGETGTWQPLTLISHMLDCSLYGKNAAGHHATNAALHSLNTLLLGLVLLRMTNAAGPSLFVAAVFGLHPLHVESVAWVSERKDVLSTVFFLAALYAYARWAETMRRRWLAASTLGLTIGLTAKPMLVTLPCVLMLLDYWPLRRVTNEHRARCLTLLAAEKLPMFALVVAASVATLAVQRGAQATSSLDALPMTLRLGNAVSAYVRYIGKTLWPADLLIFYPHPLGALRATDVAVALCCLITVTTLTWCLRRRGPYLIVGWFWYLGTLVPVIGIIQVGAQAMADRYTYIPMIGLLIMLSWSVPSALAAIWTDRVRRALSAASISVVATLAALTWSRMGVWRDSATLYRSTIQTMPDNAVANMGLGLLLVDQQRYADAIPPLETAVRQRHREPEAHYHLGIAYQGLNDFSRAEEQYHFAVDLDPDYSPAWNNLGVTLDVLGKTDEALFALERAVETGPRNQEAAGNLIKYLIRLGRIGDARARAATAAERMPGSSELKSLLAFVNGLNPGTAIPTP